jgi:hypothetical protein
VEEVEGQLYLASSQYMEIQIRDTAVGIAKDSYYARDPFA